MRAAGRLPEGRLEKAQFYVNAARDELVAKRLQSAENLVRLATVMDPSNTKALELLAAVEQARREPRK